MGRGLGDGDREMIRPLQQQEPMPVQIALRVVQTDEFSHQLAPFRELSHQRILMH
jgi:hypothetical protein